MTAITELEKEIEKRLLNIKYAELDGEDTIQLHYHIDLIKLGAALKAKEIFDELDWVRELAWMKGSMSDKRYMKSKKKHYGEEK